MKITVIGCGRWGTFIAWYLDKIGHSVSLYGRKSSAHMQKLIETRTIDGTPYILIEAADEVEINGIMLGIVSICYLGKPYEVHNLDVTGQIIEHYPGGKALPGGLEKARSLALRGGYAFIEVYVDCCRAIGRNGSVAVIPC